MPDARGIVEQARGQTQIAEGRLKNHPYLQSLEAKRIPKDRLRIFAGQQHHIIESDLRSVALGAARAASPLARDFFLGMVQGERAAAEVAFFDLFATSSEAFERGALAVITEGLDRGVDPRRIQRAARLLQDYELLYWDTLHQASTA